MMRSLIHNLSALIIAAVILTGTASAGGTEEIGIKAKLTVHLYTSMSELRREYMDRGGEQKLMNRVKGFYSDRDNSIHCVKWDYYTCGHELFHAMQYKGDRTLLTEKGYEHFKGNNYTSQ